MTTLFLPDFVGYPLCYGPLRRQLGPGARAVFADYNAYWPYPSLDRLVAQLTARYADAADRVDTVVGYSFGAHAALLLAERLGAQVRDLVLIDPPALARTPRRTAADVEALLRSNPDFAYVFDAVDSELTDLACVLGNVAMLADAPARRVTAPGTLFVAGGPERAHLVLAELDGLTDALAVITVSDRDHRSILADPAVTARLVAAATRRAS